MLNHKEGDTYFNSLEEFVRASTGSGNVVCIIGQSGSGKSTLEKNLAEKYNWNVMRSGTSRPPRTPDDDSHIFFDSPEKAKQQYAADKASDLVIAETTYGENVYWMRIDEIKADTTNLFVVDVPGFYLLMEELWDKRKTLHEIYSIFIYCDRDIRLERCHGNVERTDRNLSDYTGFNTDLIVNGAEPIERIMEVVDKWIEKEDLLDFVSLPPSPTDIPDDVDLETEIYTVIKRFNDLIEESLAEKAEYDKENKED